MPTTLPLVTAIRVTALTLCVATPVTATVAAGDEDHHTPTMPAPVADVRALSGTPDAVETPEMLRAQQLQLEMNAWNDALDHARLTRRVHPATTAPFISTPLKTGLANTINIRPAAVAPSQARTRNLITTISEVDARIGSYTALVTGTCSKKSGKCPATFDTGATYALTESIRLDAGVNVGITHTTSDLNSFIGVSWRF